MKQCGSEEGGESNFGRTVSLEKGQIIEEKAGENCDETEKGATT